MLAQIHLLKGPGGQWGKFPGRETKACPTARSVALNDIELYTVTPLALRGKRIASGFGFRPEPAV